MITLSASGGSVTFTFSGNSTYLNDGTIEVPVNSLALIIDESDMATFRKAASNDIFVSANIAEFGMTKDELMAWYKANMVGSTGGGGGVTSGEVQTMIDEAVSGKANSSDVYTTGQTSGATEIANALNAKLDATAYTPTVVDAALSQSSTNPVQNQALYGELRVGGGTSKVEIDFNTGGYVPEGVTQLEVNPTTTDSWAAYNFYNGNTRLGYYNFTNWGSFNVSNLLEGSSYVISGETVIITYPASLGVTRIALDGGNAPWSFEAIVETPAVPLKDVVSGKVETNTYTSYTANTQAVLNSKLDATAYTPVQVSSAITENDTNPVAGGAVYDKVHVTSGNGSTTLLTFGSETIPGTGFISAATNYQSGVTKFNIELDLTQWGRYNPTLGFRDSNNNIYAGQIINTDGVITYTDKSDEMFGTSMSATTSYTNNVFTIEVTGLSGDAPSGLTMFGLANMEPVVNAYAIEGETAEYWIKDYVDAKVAEAGGGCEVEETVVYDRLKQAYNDNEGDSKLTYTIIDYAGDKTTADSIGVYFEIGDTINSNNGWIYFDYVNHSANTDSLSDYVTVEYITEMEYFKVSVASAYQSTYWIRNMQGLNDYNNALIPFYTINSGSPCTVIATDIAGLVTKVKDKAFEAINSCSLQTSEDNMHMDIYHIDGRNEVHTIKLEDLDGSNNTLKPNINIPLGVSGWTSIDVGTTAGGCENCSIQNLGTLVHRLTYSYDEQTVDYSNLGSYFRIALKASGSDWYTDYQYIDFVESGSAYVPSIRSQIFDGLEPTLNWDATTKKLIVSYPATYTHPNDTYGFGTYDVVVNCIGSNDCHMGTEDLLSGIEYYAEQTQPLKPYVQETRAALGGLSLVKLTQSEYNALATKDDNTLYVVIPNP